MISIIAAVSKNGVIGKNGGIPWKLRDDMRHFMETTTGHPVIMGRGTFESMDKRPLKDRQNIVITSQSDYEAPGCIITLSLEDALSKAAQDPFIVGGSGVYKEALDRAGMLYLTRVDTEIEGDTFFPDFDLSEWQLTNSEPHAKNERNEYNFTIEIYERKH
jgi:dihydrofolate reductase